MSFVSTLPNPIFNVTFPLKTSLNIPILNVKAWFSMSVEEFISGKTR